MQRMFWTAFIIVGLVIAPWSILAETGPPPRNSEHERSRELLEKGLTLHEIERELKRLEAREASLIQDMADTGNRMRETEQRVEERRHQAGQVLRAYYMGERQSLYLHALKAKSLSDALVVIDLLQVLFVKDREILDRYSQAKEQLQQEQNRLAAEREALTGIKMAYLREKDRLVRLQEELDRELERHPAAESVLSEIETLTVEWQEQGLPLFEQYFRSLAKAMKQLDELMDEQPGMLSLGVTGATFKITDEQLNTFLRNQDPLFQSFTITFGDGLMTAVGTKDGVTAEITGRYEVGPEAENVIRFHIEELIFQEVPLPESTKRDLSDRFDLGFYPSYIASFVRAEKVELKRGTLEVGLKWTLGEKTND